MKINNEGLLVQEDDDSIIYQIPTVNFNKGWPPELPKGICLHWTAGGSGFDVAKGFTSSRQVSTHIIVGRDGSIIQCISFNDVAWHCGQKQPWREPGTETLNYNNSNSYFIGLDFSNWGYLYLHEGKYYNWLCEKYDANWRIIGYDYNRPGALMPEDTPIIEKEYGNQKYWEGFPDDQLNSMKKIIAILIERFNIDKSWIIDHAWIGKAIGKVDCVSLDIPTFIFDI